jgi:hypothetical protein
VYNIKGQAVSIDSLEHYDSFIPGISNENSTEFNLVANETGDKYKAAKVSYGETAGYTPTDMTYNGELKVKPGETITSVLDKIKQMLGNFEYFYNLDGRFVF